MAEPNDRPNTLRDLILTLMRSAIISVMMYLFSFVGLLAILGFFLYAGYQTGLQVGRAKCALESPPHDLHNTNLVVQLARQIIPRTLLPELFNEEDGSQKVAAPLTVDLRQASIEQIVDGVRKALEAYHPSGDDTSSSRSRNSGSTEEEMVRVPPSVLQPYQP